MAKLTPDTNPRRLETLERLDSGRRTPFASQYQFDDFAAAMTFVNRVAELAEEADHHPDIDIPLQQRSHGSEYSLRLVASPTKTSSWRDRSRLCENRFCEEQICLSSTRIPRRYLFTALESTPFLFDNLLRDLAPHEADLRPDPQRLLHPRNHGSSGALGSDFPRSYAAHL
jgi:hypothetical protein